MGKTQNFESIVKNKTNEFIAWNPENKLRKWFDNNANMNQIPFIKGFSTQPGLQS